MVPVSRKKPREEVPEGPQEEEGRMERAREPVLQALQQSPSVIFSPVAMRALRLGGGPRAYSFPPLVAACEPNDAAGLEQIVADAGSPGQGRAISDAGEANGAAARASPDREFVRSGR